MEKLDYSVVAWEVSKNAAQEGPVKRRRWAGQNDYDADYMHTESTRFTIEQDRKLRQCCREARVTRYTLINYLLRAWMAGWEAYKGLRQADSDATTSGGH